MPRILHVALNIFYILIEESWKEIKIKDNSNKPRNKKILPISFLKPKLESMKSVSNV